MITKKPADTSGDCEASCGLGHAWETSYMGRWLREPHREGKRRRGYRHAYVLEQERCPVCGHRWVEFHPRKGTA